MLISCRRESCKITGGGTLVNFSYFGPSLFFHIFTPSLFFHILRPSLFFHIPTSITFKPPSLFFHIPICITFGPPSLFHKSVYLRFRKSFKGNHGFKIMPKNPEITNVIFSTQHSLALKHNRKYSQVVAKHVETDHIFYVRAQSLPRS